MIFIKPIKDFEKYFVTEDGKIISQKFKKQRQLKTWLDRNKRYELIKLCKNSISYHKLVHRLVAEAFISNPDPENFLEVHHIDGNPHNNHVSNLEWTSRELNLKRSYNTMSSTRNFIECYLYKENEFIKEFKNKKEACEFASKNFDCSYTSLMKYERSKEYRLVRKV